MLNALHLIVDKNDIKIIKFSTDETANKNVCEEQNNTCDS